ncbi:MAG: Wzz/FepE/Etk N-terminal domain-containing protein [Geminicoccaceae bacterium]
MPTDTATAGISPVELVRILWRRKAVLLTVLLLGTAGAVSALAWLPRSYEARALVLIEPRLQPAVDGSGPATAIPPDSATIDSLVEVLASRTTARATIARLGLDTDPELAPPEAAVERFMARLQVGRQGKSNVIGVAFASGDPARAAEVANAVADAFVAERAAAQRRLATSAAGAQGERLGLLERRLAEAEAAVAAARARLGLVAGGTSIDDMAGLRRDLVGATAERTAREARLDRLRQQIRQAGSDAAIGDGRGSELLETLQESKADLVRQEAELASQYGERHPRLVDLRAEKAAVEGKIGREQRAIVDQYAGEVDAARAREQALGAALAAAEQAAGEQGRAAAELRTLEAQAASDRRLYEAELGRGKGPGTVVAEVPPDARVISEATPPVVAAFPKPLLLLTVSLAASLAIGLFAVYAIEQADRRLRTGEEVRRSLGLGTLGMVPAIGRREARRLPLPEWPLQRPGSREAEAVRTLLTGLDLPRRGEACRVVMLTSAVPNEGKSSLCLALGRAAAEEGLRVLLIDADLRRPSLARMLGLTPGLGLAELAAARASLGEVLQGDPRSSVRVIPGSAAPGPPTGLLGEAGIAAVLQAARAGFDLVLVDTAPLLPVADAARLAPLVDRIALVVRWGATTAPMARQALVALGPARERVTGAILSRVDLRRHRAWSEADPAVAYGRYRGYYTA